MPNKFLRTSALAPSLGIKKLTKGLLMAVSICSSVGILTNDAAKAIKLELSDPDKYATVLHTTPPSSPMDYYHCYIL